MCPSWRGLFKPTARVNISVMESYLSLQSLENVSVRERLFKPNILGRCVRYGEVI